MGKICHSQSDLQNSREGINENIRMGLRNMDLPLVKFLSLVPFQAIQ